MTDLLPLKFPSSLAEAPTTRPKYFSVVKNKLGSEVYLGDPNITRVVLAIMNQYAANGGAASHWGGPSAFSEIMSALHGLMFSDDYRHWYQAFNFVNDAGHTENGIYALRANLGFNQMSFKDLWSFRQMGSPYTGHGEAHLNPAGVLISNGPLGSGLPQAQGLALADKIIGSQRVTICTISDGGLMEGEAKEACAAIPGLAEKGKLNPFLMVISDNNTKLSGRIDKDSFSMNPTFESLETLGWGVEFVDNGHDLQTVYSALEESIKRARLNPQQPQCIVFKTIKGQGVRETELQESGGHGFPLKKNDGKILDFIKEIMKGEVPLEFMDYARELMPKGLSNASAAPTPSAPSAAGPSEKVQVGISRGAIKAVQEGLPVYSLSADLAGSTGMHEFQKAYPQFHLDIGVAESNMVSTAIGLSKAGLLPIVDTFAQFGITKGNLPLIMSSLSLSPVVGVFSHTGFQDAADGASHQATTYFSAISGIPHLQVVCCASSREAESYMFQALKNLAQAREKGEVGESVIFFLGRENYPPFYSADATYQWQKAQILRQGKGQDPNSQADLTIVACGPMVPYALSASEILQERGISAIVVNNPFVNRPDIATIGTCLDRSKNRLLTLEDHQVVGGMGSQLGHKLLLAGRNFSMQSIGMKGEFGQSAYSAQDLYQHHGMDQAGILQAVEKLIK